MISLSSNTMLPTAACGPPAWASASASPRAALAAARVPLLRAQASDEDEYLADLEQQAPAQPAESPPTQHLSVLTRRPW